MSETQEKPAFPRVIVGGDAHGGWLIDIHDGEHHGVYSPAAGDEAAALAAAWDEHNARFARLKAAVAAAETAIAAVAAAETAIAPEPTPEPAPELAAPVETPPV